MSALTRLMAIMMAIGLVAACSEQPAEPPAPEPSVEATTDAPPVEAAETRITGTIRSTEVELTGAEFDGDLAVFEGDGWGFNPSLLIFLFLDDDTPPEGRTITVEPSDGLMKTEPHVHYRWHNAETDAIDVESTMEGYRLVLRFGTIEDGHLPGHLEFSIPDEDTSVSGPFRAVIEQ